MCNGLDSTNLVPISPTKTPSTQIPPSFLGTRTWSRYYSSSTAPSSWSCRNHVCEVCNLSFFFDKFASTLTARIPASVTNVLVFMLLAESISTIETKQKKGSTNVINIWFFIIPLSECISTNKMRHNNKGNQSPLHRSKNSNVTHVSLEAANKSI